MVEENTSGAKKAITLCGIGIAHIGMGMVIFNRMKNCISSFLLIFLLIMNFSSFAQTKAAFKKVKEFYLKKGASSNKTISYIEKSQELILGKFSVPIRRVNFSYEGKNEEATEELYRVKISCPVPHACILDKEKETEVLGFLVSFKSKEDCLHYIALLSELKEAAVLVKE